MSIKISFLLILFGLVIITIEYPSIPIPGKPSRPIICYREFFDDNMCSHKCIEVGKFTGTCIWNDIRDSSKGYCLCLLDFLAYIYSRKRSPADRLPGLPFIYSPTTSSTTPRTLIF